MRKKFILENVVFIITSQVQVLASSLVVDQFYCNHGKLINVDNLEHQPLLQSKLLTKLTWQLKHTNTN